MGYLNVKILSKIENNWSFVVENRKLKKKAMKQFFLSNYKREQ